MDINEIAKVTAVQDAAMEEVADETQVPLPQVRFDVLSSQSEG